MNINILVPQNNTLFIAIIVVFILFSIVMYAFPSIFIYLFGNILGNLLLAVAVIALAFFDKRWAIGLAAIFVILYQAYHLTTGPSSWSSSYKTESSIKEGFTQWSSQLQSDFLNFQKIYNPHYRFDMNILQSQASPQEVEYLLKYKKWPWSTEIQDLYKEATITSSTISVDPDVALQNAQSIYNEQAIKELLSWNSKEGAFLLTGVTIGHSKGIPANYNNTVRCGMNNKGEIGMDKIINIGYSGIDASMLTKITRIANDQIPKWVPGFSFLKNTCNPCVALDDPPSYSCPFAINIGNGNAVSPIWRNLWGLDDAENNSKTEFPLLADLSTAVETDVGVMAPNTNTPVKDVTVPLVLDDSNTHESPYENANI